VTLVTGYQLGLIALLVGILAGAGARMGGPGRAAQWTGAICAAVAYFIGQMAIISALALTHGAPPDEATGRTSASRPSAETAADPLAASAPAAALDADFEGTSASASLIQLLALLAWMLLIVFVVAVVETFTSLSIVFLGIAVYEGWRIPRAS
jgi:hypothetical protein